VRRTLARSLRSNAGWLRERASRASSLLACSPPLLPPTACLPLASLSLPLTPPELSTLTREQRFLFDIYNRESTIAQANEMQRSANSDEWDSFIDAINGGIATI
jgi:hypothetical protein